MHHHAVMFNQRPTNGSSADGHTNPTNGNKESDNTAAAKPKSGPIDKEFRIKFSDWGFKVDRLFEVAHRFYKRNESKAFHLGFDERNKMIALVMQAKFGNIHEGKAPDIGVLDLVGKRRQYEWSLLKGMTKTEAMTKFICELDDICPIFKAYAEAVKISSGIDFQDSGSDESRRNGLKLVGQSGDPSLLESSAQLPGIYSSLCKQTHSQFKTYAEKQHPGDVAKQKHLIASLQEQYYQQYISQMNPKIRDDSAVSRDSLVLDIVTTTVNQPAAGSDVSSNFEARNDARPLDSESGQVGMNHIDEPEAITTNNKVAEESEFGMIVQERINSEENNVQADISCEELNSESNSDIGQLSDSNLNTSSRTTSTRGFSSSSHVEEQPKNLIETVKLGQNFDLPPIGMFESFPEPKLVQTPQRTEAHLDAIDPNLPSRSPRQSQDGGLPNARTEQDKESTQSHNQPEPENGGNIKPVITPYEQISPRNETHQDDQENFTSIPSACSGTIQAPDYIIETETVSNNGTENMATESLLNQQTELLDQNGIRQPELWGRISPNADCNQGNSSFVFEPLEPATIWTKRAVAQFKDSLGGDKQAGVYEIKEGALIVIQVPTYPDGKYIYWEFATDDYDIGFGIDFVHNENLVEPLALNIYQDNDEDEDLETLVEVDDWRSTTNPIDDLEFCRSGLVSDRDRLLAQKRQRLANTVPILPTYRRDSHEEVCVGRHKYPGRGYYLLKFDNTYSVLRSKTLYFRICYFM